MTKSSSFLGVRVIFGVFLYGLTPGSFSSFWGQKRGFSQTYVENYFIFHVGLGKWPFWGHFRAGAPIVVNFIFHFWKTWIGVT